MLKLLLSRPVENVVITTKGLQDRNNLLLDGRTVENKGKLILTVVASSNQHALTRVTVGRDIYRSIVTEGRSREELESESCH